MVFVTAVDLSWHNERNWNSVVKQLLKFLVFLLLLVACTDARLPGSDPLSDLAGADATQSAANAAIRQTARAADAERSQSTMQAARTQGAAQIQIDLLQAQIDATRQADDLILAHATQTAGVQAVNTAASAAALASRPTQTAQALIIVHELDMIQRKQALDIFWLYFIPLVGMVILIGLIILSVRLGLDLYQNWVKWRTLDNSIRGYEGSRFTWEVNGELPKIVAGTRPLPITGPQPLKPIGAGNVAWTSSMPVRYKKTSTGSTADNPVIRLIEDGISIVGDDSRQLPGWRVLQEYGLAWESGPWQAAVRPLVNTGAIVPRPRVAVNVADEYYDLAGLLEAITTGKINIDAA